VKSAPVTFKVDTTAPQVSLDAVGIGGSTSDSKPAFTGSAGSAGGDSLQVRTFVYSGLSDTGTPLATFTGNRSGASFVFKATSALPVGTYTARAEQVDAAGNTGRSVARTFAVTSAVPAANLRDAMMADAPRAYWRVGEASGTVAADQASFANTGGYQGGPALGQAGVVPVAQSTAIALDGTDDTVRVPSSASLNPAAALALEAWIRPSALRPPRPRSAGRTFSTWCGSPPPARSPSASGTGAPPPSSQRRRARSARVPGTTWWPPSTALPWRSS
jgi:Bacterial Ig-like domain